jgi:dTDP-4-amino-4,6-dideoxygalactose transaminase
MATIEVPAAAAVVPFFDPRPADSEVKTAVMEAFAAIVDEGRFANGPAVASFERAFAEFCGVPECVGVASGLDALRLALIGSGLKPGDEVLVPANTFVATFEAVTQAGGTPVPVDVTELDYNIDVDAAAAAVSLRTRYVLPVHLYGQLADMQRILDLAASHGLIIVEDACQAHGATRDGIRAGAAGDAAAFSFYPGKNLGAFGDAGAIVTADATIAAQARSLREHGQRTKYRHERVGYTARLDTLQAAVLLEKLARLDRWNEERRTLARIYVDGLAGVGDCSLPPVPAGSNPVWHLFPLRTAGAEALASFLAARGIATGRHYPEPPHLSGAYASLGYGRGDFPVAERLAEELLSLPLFPGMTPVQQEAVITAVRAFFGDG